MPGATLCQYIWKFGQNGLFSRRLYVAKIDFEGKFMDRMFTYMCLEYPRHCSSNKRLTV